MILWILLALLVLFGVGFAMHFLWIAAVVLLAVWALGFGWHHRSS